MIFEVLLVTSIFLRCGHAQDFLWKDNNGKLVDRGKKQIVPKRWARSLYTWVHSPLINSVEEVIEIDADKSYSSSTARAIKRFPRQNTEKFEEEFFLWQDEEGKPLKFGLKQIDENHNIPFQPPNNHDFRQQRKNEMVAPLWQNPLFYEDNNDIEDDSKDSHLFSFHEDGKLSHIIRNKFESILSFFNIKKTSDNSKLTTTKTKEDLNKLTLSKNTSEILQKQISHFKKGLTNSNNSLDTDKEGLNITHDQTEKKYEEFHLGNSMNNSSSLNNKEPQITQNNVLNKSENPITSNSNSRRAKNGINNSSKTKVEVNSSSESHVTTDQSKNNNAQIAEEIQDYKSLKKLFSQPKFHQLSFVENSQNEIEDSDKTFDGFKKKVQNECNHSKMKKIRKHKVTHSE